MLVRAVAVLLSNAVPLVGVLTRGWNAGTVLALFWCETMLLAIANSVRIALHRRWTHLAGHWHSGVDFGRTRSAATPAVTRTTRSYLAEYARMVFPFTLAHGLFLLVLLAMLSSNDIGGKGVAWLPRWSDLRSGLAWTAGVAASELLVDLINLRARPFTWLKAKVEASYSRVLVLHLGIIVGTVAIAMTSRPVALLLAVIGIKTAIELLAAIYGRDSLPERMPRWFAAVVRKTGKDPAIEWQQMLESERRAREAWDTPLSEGAS
jgi:hypothetical protein